MENKDISFPLGLADGPYFCNREEETKLLLRNIKNGMHTVLISPRRYGKTSLAYRALKSSHLPNASIDLYMTTNPSDITRAIIAGVDNILSQISNNAEMLLNLIKDYIKLLRPSFEAGSHGLKIKLQTIDAAPSAANICEALKILDSVLKNKSQRAVLLIDEFQEVHSIAPDAGIEGAIRHIAQETKNITFIFSGSHRHLLKNMFNNRNKPLYRLCDEIQLERIHPEDYIPFIKKFSEKKWKATLSDNIINTILNLSECHAYYFNAICEKLFAKEKIPTTVKQVEKIWDELILLKKKDILSETKHLTITHKKVLVAIANGINKELTGHKFLQQADVAGSSVLKALEYLEDHDFIEKKQNSYFVIDPLLKSVIRQLTYF